MQEKKVDMPYTSIDVVSTKGQGWMHISCSYTYQQDVHGTVHSFSGELDESYDQSLSKVPYYLPSDQYTLYIGNSYLGIEGSKGVFLKDLRFW